MNLSDKKERWYFIFFCIIIFFFIIFIKSSWVRPTMDDDQYFVDKNGQIHNNCCSYRKVPPFSTKHNKYDFIMKKDWEFCKECFLNEEIKKLWHIHEYNIEKDIKRLRRAGADEEYIQNRIDLYVR